MSNSYLKCMRATLLFAVFLSMTSSFCISSTILWMNADLLYDILNFVAPLIYIPVYSFILLGYLSAVILTVMYYGIVHENREVLIAVSWIRLILCILLLTSVILTETILCKSDHCVSLDFWMEIECKLDNSGNFLTFYIYENGTELIHNLEHNEKYLDFFYRWECKRFAEKSMYEFKLTFIWYFITWIIAEAVSSYVLLSAFRHIGRNLNQALDLQTLFHQDVPSDYPERLNFL